MHFPRVSFVSSFLALFCLSSGAVLCATDAAAQSPFPPPAPSSAGQSAVAAPAVRITSAIEESRLTPLPATRHPLATPANDRGPLDDATPLGRVHLVLQRSPAQESALRTLIDDMHNPGSPRFHRWLTPEQFGSQFGPADADLATVQGWLAGHGFNSVRVLPGRQVIEFSGNAGQFREAFHTSIHKYAVNNEIHYANAAAPQIPAALAPVLGGFASLNNFRPRSHARLLGRAQYNRRTDRATPPQAAQSANQPSPEWAYASANVLSPQDFSIQYDLNPLYSAGTNGAGQTIAIINESNIDIALVNRFRSIFGLPANPPQVLIDGNDPGIDGINNPNPNFASTEAYLDVEWAGAVAPAATIDLVIAADTSLESGLFLAAEYAVYNNLAPVMSLSFGECEAVEGAFNAYLSGLWEQAAAQGITVLVSAGDNGSAGCDDFNTQAYAVAGQAVNGMASTPYNIAVGGTDFYYSDYNSSSSALTAQIDSYWNTNDTHSPAISILGVVPEQPWNDSQFGLNAIPPEPLSANLYATTISGGSGGASNSAICASGKFDTSGNCTGTLAGYPKPSWQSGTGVPADGVRDLPDVSLFAATGFNFSFYPICVVDGDCQPVTGNDTVQITGVGGTSAATPAFAGIMALVNQLYGPQGQANFILYPLAAQVPAAFHDITVGTNSVPCNLNTINAMQTFPPKDCIKATPALTGDDPFYGISLEGQIGTGANTEYKAVPGYDLASGLGSVDAFQLVSNWFKVAHAATTTTINASPRTLTHGAAVSINGTVSGGGPIPTGQVALMTNSTEPGKQSGVVFPLSGGSFSGSVSNLPGGSYTLFAHYAGDSANSPSTSSGVPITVAPESSTSSIALLRDGNTPVTSGTNNLPYGAFLTLSVTPRPKTHALTFCNPGQNSGCASFQFPTGTVAFYDRGVAIGTAVVDGRGQAELTPSPSFAPGPHSITASYSGDASYKASTAPAFTFSLMADTPIVQIGSVQNTYPQGTSIALTILVESGQFGTAPSGTVTLSNAPTGTQPTLTLSPALDPTTGTAVGVATALVPANAPSGTFAITAQYTPDAASAAAYTSAATSIAYPLTIEGPSGEIPTTITASLSSDATSPSHLVGLSGTVTPASGTSAPTGPVNLYVLAGMTGSAQPLLIGSPQLNTSQSGNSSTFSWVLARQFLFPGLNQIIVMYAGDGVHQASETIASIKNPLSDFSLLPEAALLPVKAGVDATDTLDLTSTYGYSGTVNLACTTPAGLTCTLDAASVSLVPGLRAPIKLTVNDSNTAPGQTCNVMITGSSADGSIIHNTAVRIVNCAYTSPALITPGVDVEPQQPAITTLQPLSVVVGVNAGSTAATPTGSVTLSGGGYTAAPATLAGGSATVTIPAGVLAQGTNTLTAVYIPDLTSASLYNQATGTATVVVTPPGQVTPGVVVDLSAGNITTAQPLTVTASVSYSGYPTPTGSISLSGAYTSTSPTQLVNGSATMTIPAGILAVGEDMLTATYTPDKASLAEFTTATGSASVTVSPLGTPSFALTSSGNISFVAGATTGNTATLTFTPTNGFTGSIDLSCAVSTTIVAPQNQPTCAIPANVTISGTTPATATLTVNTTATAQNRLLRRFPFSQPFSGGGLVVAFLLLIGVPRRKAALTRLLGLLLFFVTIAGSGCGGHSSSTTLPPSGGTTPGAYTVTVTASVGGGQAQTIGVTVTVN
jgi:hypothetical protein